MVHSDSFLFITLDSCRFDMFEKANIPNLKGLGPYRKCYAPANFTYPSHQAMFMGFLPGDRSGEKYWDSRRARIFHLESPTSTKAGEAYVRVQGRNIIQGFKNAGYKTLGIGAVGWFDNRIPSGRVLTQDFEKFVYTGSAIVQQVRIAEDFLAEHKDQKQFIFINVGETHTPYHFPGSPYPLANYCLPFEYANNNRAECEKRQKACLEYVDKNLKSLLQKFSQASIVVCADHGDAWGENGLWEHSVTCAPVMTVPMTMRLRKK